mmetsp:Transcript_25053/g.43849  ORF Transcript_25053/g.43849 Transcript_25053/m.43849 type:complete len:130 (-) Transcript_25053:189-578(-)
MVSVVHLASLLLTFLLLGLPHKGSSSSTGQQSRSHSSKSYPTEAQQQQARQHLYSSYKPTTSILTVKSLYSHSDTTASSDGTKDDFARLNKRNKYGGPITRDSVHEAVVQTTRQRPSQDIVVMGVASWN